MNHSICLIVPYFGKLPSYINLFLKSVEFNPTIDICFFTDDEVNIKSPNLMVIKSSLAEIKARIEKVLGFKINLEKPYKLCDYRPVFGLAFADYLKDYDFWGYCDIDLVFGDIRKFITSEILDNYDKVYQHGHLTLNKNNDEVNHEFMSSFGIDYKKVFTSNINFVFDELSGIQQKFDHDGFKTYKEFDFIDVNPWRYHIERCMDVQHDTSFDYEHECFFWDEGHLYREALVDKKIDQQEFLYFHFQKRQFNTPEDVLSSNCFYLTNDGCVVKQGPTAENDIEKYNVLSPEKDKELERKRKQYLLRRRINKYVFHRGG